MFNEVFLGICCNIFLMIYVRISTFKLTSFLPRPSKIESSSSVEELGLAGLLAATGGGRSLKGEEEKFKW